MNRVAPTGRVVAPGDLNAAMDFDCVIQVQEDGSISDRLDLDGPELYDGKLPAECGWTLLDGYSGQDRYSGPIMHNSEFIGGGMARDILARPGLYVALLCYWDSAEDSSELEPNDVEGWAVAYRETP